MQTTTRPTRKNEDLFIYIHLDLSSNTDPGDPPRCWLKHDSPTVLVFNQKTTDEFSSKSFTPVKTIRSSSYHTIIPGALRKQKF